MPPKPTLARLPRSTIVAAGVAVALTAVLFWTAGDAFTPATRVQVAPVVFDAATEAQPQADADAPRQPAGQAIQAPGWLEPAPYYTSATALTDGIVAEVLALEGQTVEKGQAVARLVPDDALIALAAAEAELATAEAELAVAQANLRAAQTDWENPVERERAVAATRAQLAETRAQLEQLPALIDAERAMLKRMEAELARATRAQEGGAANELEVIVLTQRVAGQAATLRATEQRRASWKRSATVCGPRSPPPRETSSCALTTSATSTSRAPACSELGPPGCVPRPASTRPSSASIA